jgi:hypothetical protein
VEFIALSGDEKARWDKQLEGLTDAWIAEMKPKGYPADEIVADIRRLIKKHAK